MSPVRSRTEKADAMTFVSQLDPQASSWFDRSSFKVQQCRTPSTAAAFRLRWRNRTATTFPPPSSTMSNSIDSHIPFSFASSLPVNNVKLHRPAVCQVQSCRIPSAPVQGGMPVNNVKLHRQPYRHHNGNTHRLQCRTPSTIQRYPVLCSVSR